MQEHGEPREPLEAVWARGGRAEDGLADKLLRGDRFSWCAFLFGTAYFAYRRCWLVAVLYFVALRVLQVLLRIAGTPVLVMALFVATIAVPIVLGFCYRRIFRWQALRLAGRARARGVSERRFVKGKGGHSAANVILAIALMLVSALVGNILQGTGVLPRIDIPSITRASEGRIVEYAQGKYGGTANVTARDMQGVDGLTNTLCDGFDVELHRTDGDAGQTFRVWARHDTGEVVGDDAQRDEVMDAVVEQLREMCGIPAKAFVDASTSTGARGFTLPNVMSRGGAKITYYPVVAFKDSFNQGDDALAFLGERSFGVDIVYRDKLVKKADPAALEGVRYGTVSAIAVDDEFSGTAAGLREGESEYWSDTAFTGLAHAKRIESYRDSELLLRFPGKVVCTYDANHIAAFNTVFEYLAQPDIAFGRTANSAHMEEVLLGPCRLKPEFVGSDVTLRLPASMQESWQDQDTPSGRHGITAFDRILLRTAHIEDADIDHTLNWDTLQDVYADAFTKQHPAVDVEAMDAPDGYLRIELSDGDDTFVITGQAPREQ